MATLPAIQMKCVAMWEGLALIQRASATLGFLLSGCTAASQANRKRQEKKNTERTEQRWWCGSADSRQQTDIFTAHVSASGQRTKTLMFGSTVLYLHDHQCCVCPGCWDTWLPLTHIQATVPHQAQILATFIFSRRSLALYLLHLCESSIIINFACVSDLSGREKEGKILF